MERWVQLRRKIGRVRVKNRLERVRANTPVKFVETFLRRFSRHQVPIYAAAMSYYMFLSAIPLLLFLLFVGSFFLEAKQVQAFALRELDTLLPFSSNALRANLRDVLRFRGTLGTLSALGTLWSTSGMFSALESAVNSVWDRPVRRSFWERRLMGVMALLALTAWILLTLWTRTLAEVLPYWFPVLQTIPLPISPWTGRLISFISIALLNISVYLFFPRATVRRGLAFAIGFGVGLLWIISREFFAWALTVGILRYPLVYGSLWVLIVPIIWSYWSYLLLLSGAELQAYLEERRRQTEKGAVERRTDVI